MSVTDAIERAQKCEHENQNLLRTQRNLENELRSIQSANKRLKEDLMEEKKKHRGVHVDKLSAERKLTELLAEKTRLEVFIQLKCRRDLCL